MNNVNTTQTHPDFAHDSTFDTGLMIFTAAFFVGLFFWCRANSTEPKTTSILKESAGITTTDDKQQNVNYSNLFMGLDMEKIENTLNKVIERNTLQTIEPAVTTIESSSDCIELPTILEPAATEKVTESIAENTTEETPTSEKYMLNKSLANDHAVGPADLFKDINFSQKGKKVEKEEVLELIDGSELIMISMNEMHTLKLPGGTDMELTFIKSDGNESINVSKMEIDELEELETSISDLEVVKGDELAFISDHELDEIKIIESENNNSNTNEFAIKGIQDRSMLLYNTMETARAENKAIMLSFGAKWCLPCKEMYKNVFPNPVVKALMDENYISHRLDANDLEAISIKQIYNVEAYPTTLFLFPNGVEYDRYQEGISVDKMLQILNQNRLLNFPEYIGDEVLPSS